jgi:hypothetical protein
MGRSLQEGWPLTDCFLSGWLRCLPLVSGYRSSVNPEVAGSNPVEPAK